MYNLEIEIEVVKIFKKLGKKDPTQLKAINKKIEHVLANPHQFKPLKYPLQNLRRVHVGSFVLVYEIIENLKIVRILKYKHHDEAYK